MAASALRKQLLLAYPWVKSPLIVSAPMKVIAGPQLAVAVSLAGGLGFIGPGARPEDTLSDLETARDLMRSSSLFPSAGAVLPVGVGFLTWDGNLKVAASAVRELRPCAAWLFAPRSGQAELDEWAAELRSASPRTQIWTQVGTLAEATDAARSPAAPDVLVIQGAEAGGHGRARDGQGTVVLLPEIADALRSLAPIPLVAAGGIIDGRGVAASLSLGAAGVAMGTRMLAAAEARIADGYRDEVIRAADGGKSTVRTQLYNHLRGTFGWPEPFSPRTVVNRSWIEHQAGVPFEELKRRHDEAAGTGDAGWGPEGRLATYAGAGVGLVRSIAPAGHIVEAVRGEARDIIQRLAEAV